MINVGEGEKRKTSDYNKNSILSLALDGVRGSFQAFGLRKNIFCSIPDVLGCLLPKPVLNPFMKLG